MKLNYFGNPPKFVFGTNFATMINSVPEGYFEMPRLFIRHLELDYVENLSSGPGGRFTKYPRFFWGSFTKMFDDKKKKKKQFTTSNLRCVSLLVVITKHPRSGVPAY